MLAPPVEATVLLVRHADVAGGADDPALTDAGATRAQELGHVLGDAGVDAIFVTSWRRSRQTAAPIALELSVDPTELDDPDDVTAALRTRPPSSVALVVGHTNTVPEIIAGLGGPADVTIDHDEFDRLFVLSGTRLTRLRYGA